MKLFENWGTFIFVFILTLILGYYLGLAISTTVDYKLQDIKIRMPKPRNNITIEIIKNPKRKYKLLNKRHKTDKSDKDESNIDNPITEENFINDVKVTSNNKEIENYINYPNKVLKKKGKNKKKRVKIKKVINI